MKRCLYQFLSVVLLTATSVLFSSCGNQGQQNILPVGGSVYTCTAGQACVATSGTGYLHYTGNLASINNGIARNMISTYYGVSNWCLGGCYNTSTIDVVISNGSAQVTINLGGYVISGQGAITQLNANGNDIQVYPFGGGNRIDVYSPSAPLNGSFPNIPSVPVQYGGQQFATASLMIQPY